MASSSLKRILLLAILAALTLTGCTAPGGTAPVTATQPPTASPTPTATPIPLAVSVNEEGITIPEFEAEVSRYQKAQVALGNTVSEETAKKVVSTEFVDTLLLAQGAASKGYTVDDATLQNRIDSLSAQIGGGDKLATWETAYGYTDASFRSDLRRQMAAAHMRDKIAAAVPATAEQVHAKQILLTDAAAAQQALGYLKAGRNFNDLAAQYDPVTKGELGWFPRGYLSDQTIEHAAFALQPGQYSNVIQTQAGYDVLFVVERDPARPLSPDALLVFQEHAVQDWLTQQRIHSTILIAP